MEKFKGTKGEWSPNVISTITIRVNAEINKTDQGIYSQNVCEFILPDTDEEYEKDREEIEANAKLIAAAPELLEALLTWVKFADSKNLDYESSMIRKSKKAIEKAL